MCIYGRVDSQHNRVASSYIVSALENTENQHFNLYYRGKGRVTCDVGFGSQSHIIAWYPVYSKIKRHIFLHFGKIAAIVS